MKSFFEYYEIIILVISFLFCYMSIMFAYEIMNSNLGSAAIEIIIAGTAAYFLAKYFFIKEMKMKEREENVKNQKIKNDFQYYLRMVHITSRSLGSQKDISQMELKELATQMYKAIESHKIFKPTNIENMEILENMEKLIEKWTDGKMKLNDEALKADMKIICNLVSKIGKKYNFDLSIA